MSTNPYAQPPAGAATASSPEQQQQFDYELAVGPNNDYYVPRLQRFDAGDSQAGWHWPAFFVTSWWFLYRKMYGLGVLNLFFPLIALIVAAVIAAIAKLSGNALAILLVVLLIAQSVVFSVFANALYWRHIRKVIRNVPSSFANQPDKRAARIERNGGTGVGPMLAIMLGVLFFGGSVGAGIAIPAFRDFTIRAQVIEGLNLASAHKAQVEDIWTSEHRWAEQSDIPAGVPDSGKYVEKVEVFTGSVVITFGSQANMKIRGQRMAIQPATNQDGDIRWVCGNAATPNGWTPSGGYAGSDVPDKYMPAMCRSGQ